MDARLSDEWWKNAVFYCLDVETFLDGNGDGQGDLAGLAQRIDYLAGIGVTCLWLMPFQPTPNRDDGYDITDYYGVDPRVGTLGDLVVMLRLAHERGMRVLMDLVVNHTSDQHPWFQAARADPSSPYREFYVWRDEEPEEPPADIVFPDAEDSIWAFDDKAGQWYLHHFYSHQPDLNIESPAVRDEIMRIVGFWLQLGVDGFRVDAVPYLVESVGPGLDPHGLLKQIRAFVNRRRGDAVLLGEVNLPTEKLVRYFGNDLGDELHLLFQFPLNQQLYLALARREAAPLAGILQEMGEKPRGSQWAIFVRNHDELSLDQLSDEERQEVFAAFAPDEDMQLFGRGIRRRLPPMLDGDERRIRCVYSLLLSLPGAPVLFYGEEIGMGENLDIEGRLAVRTPMQWTDEPTAGFTHASPQELRRPLPDGRFGPAAVNEAAQRRDPDSLLNWMERMVRRRRETPELGWGEVTVLDAGEKAVLVHRTRWEGRNVVVAHNLGPDPVTVTVRPETGPGTVVDLLDRDGAARRMEGELRIDLDPFGYRWLRIDGTGAESP
jgi:trehalose synthase